MISALYSTKAASELTGASRQIIRAYTERYKEHLSSEVQPEPGQPRRFTEQDLKLIAYVYTQTTQQGQKHEQVIEQLSAGELDRFQWQAPERPAEPAREAQSAAEGALVPVQALQAAQALMADAQRREAEAAERERQLQERINDLERELGKAQGALEAWQAARAQRAPRPKWLQWLAGGQ